MNPTTKMLLMSREKEQKRSREDWPERGENEQRRYESQRRSPMNEMGNYESPMYPYYGGGMEIEGRTKWNTPQYDEPAIKNTGRRVLGFSGGDESFKRSPDEMQRYSGDEMTYRSGSMEHGRGSSDSYMPLNKDMADMWLKGMNNEDGTHGPHWSLEQAKQLMAQKHVDCDPIEFWAALNMVYSDYVKVAKKHGVGGNLDFYVDMAKAFLDDKDAKDDKIGRYFAYVVQH